MQLLDMLLAYDTSISSDDPQLRLLVQTKIRPVPNEPTIPYKRVPTHILEMKRKLNLPPPPPPITTTIVEDLVPEQGYDDYDQEEDDEEEEEQYYAAQDQHQAFY
jgi:hypothetical protein